MIESFDSDSPPAGEVDKFPDEQVPEIFNCFQYVFYKLGLEPADQKFLDEDDIKENFDRVKSREREDAEALAIFHKPSRGYDHMVYIDRKSGGQFIHKRNGFMPIEETTIDELREIYPTKTYRYDYLAKKEKDNNSGPHWLNRFRKG